MKASTEKIQRRVSEAERHWLNGFFNRLEYMSFLVNERFIPRKLFTRDFSQPPVVPNTCPNC